jgi:hypothetical protein
MQQALVMAPQRGVSHSGFRRLAGDPPPSPMGGWQCRALHVGLHARERQGLCAVRRPAGAACETSKAQVTCMARLVACRDAMAAGRGSGRVVGVRAVWTIVRHTEDIRAVRVFPVSSGLRLHATIGERAIHSYWHAGRERTRPA